MGSINKTVNRVFFWFVTGILRVFFGLLTKLCYVGPAHIPRGSLLLVCNHISHFDPPIMGALFPRKIDFMAIKELFHGPFWSGFFHLLDVFPVERGAVDPGAIRTVLQRLKQGRIVCLYPEGGIRSGNRSILTGAGSASNAAALARMADVPVRVSIIIGPDQLYRWQNLFQRRPVYFIVGSEFQIDKNLPTKEARQKLSTQIETEFRELYASFLSTYTPPDYVLPHTAQERWALKI